MSRPMRLATVGGLLLVQALLAASLAGGPAAAQEGRNCVLFGDKVASPARVLLGETVQVRLTLRAECPAAVLREADVVLAIDQSVSMAQEGKLDAAKAAARSFVDATDLSLHRIGVVSFAGSARVAFGLSQDALALKSAVDGITILPSTNISDAIDTGADMLRTDGRPGSKRVIILISDGSPNQPMPDPRAAAVVSANFAKLDGVEIFTIGLGRDADVSLMQALADSADHYYFAPGSDDVGAIYEAIAVLIAESAVRDVVLDDVLSAPVDLVDASSVPAAAVSGKTLTWQVATLPTGGLTWIYEVKPSRAGTFATNDSAVARYANADGSEGAFVFPVPEITVVDPNEGVPCTDPEPWSVLVHAFPDVIGQGCNNRFDAGDWFAGTNPGLPPLEFELTDATGTRVLYRGKAVPGPGRVDQRLLVRACEPPPYLLRLVTEDLGGYELCPELDVVRVVPERWYRRSPFRATEVRYGFVPR